MLKGFHVYPNGADFISLPPASDFFSDLPVSPLKARRPILPSSQLRWPREESQYLLLSWFEIIVDSRP